MLGRDFWRRGYATEAALALRQDAFDRLSLTRLISLIHPDNRASIRVAEKLGIRQERTAETGIGRILVYSTGVSSLE